MSFATELSNKINELQYNTLPADAVHWAKVGILDTVGVTIAGAAEDAALRNARAVGEALASSVGQAARAGNLALLRSPAHAHDPIACRAANRRDLREGLPSCAATECTAIERVEPIVGGRRKPADIGGRKGVG